jgi:hypothetical protein
LLDVLLELARPKLLHTRSIRIEVQHEGFHYTRLLNSESWTRVEPGAARPRDTVSALDPASHQCRVASAVLRAHIPPQKMLCRQAQRASILQFLQHLEASARAPLQDLPEMRSVLRPPLRHARCLHRGSESSLVHALPPARAGRRHAPGHGRRHGYPTLRLSMCVPHPRPETPARKLPHCSQTATLLSVHARARTSCCRCTPTTSKRAAGSYVWFLTHACLCRCSRQAAMAVLGGVHAGAVLPVQHAGGRVWLRALRAHGV